MGERSRQAKARKPYRLQARAQAMERTRARITAAAIHLHGSVGPAATTMSAVAERAGVTRATLYRHFPSEAALFAACSAEWRAHNPAPDPAAWATVADPGERVEVALLELYAWYRGTEAMRANLLRDLHVMPDPIQAGIAAYPGTVLEALDVGWPTPARLRRAAIAHAVAFATWRSLATHGLSDADAVRLMTDLVHGAGRPGPGDDS
jgi:AcrR family transcriptional regulator